MQLIPHQCSVVSLSVSGVSAVLVCAVLTTACGGGETSTHLRPALSTVSVEPSRSSTRGTKDYASITFPTNAVSHPAISAGAIPRLPTASDTFGETLAVLDLSGKTFAAPIELSLKNLLDAMPLEWSMSGIVKWLNSVWKTALASTGVDGENLVALVSGSSEWIPVRAGGADSSPDFAWEVKDKCFRTTDSTYNAEITLLATQLFGKAPTEILGCVTEPYLANGYSKHYSGNRNHAGIDFRAETNTPIYSPIAGRVVRRQLDIEGKRSTLTIEGLHNGQRVRALFLHCQSHNHFRGTTSLGELTEKNDIQVGDQVCQAGSVGADASHLHFEVKLPGQDLDNLLAMSERRGVCQKSSFPDGWDEGKRTYSKLTKPGCNLSDIRSGTIDPTDLISNPRLVTRISIGPVRLGMTLEDAKRVLRRATLERGTDGDGVALVAVKVDGVEQFYLFAEEEDPEAPIRWSASISSMTTFNPYYHTAEGVHPGSRIEDVKKIYGRVVEISLSEIESRQYIDFSKDPPGLSFRLNYSGIFPDNSRSTREYGAKAEIFGIATDYLPPR